MHRLRRTILLQALMALDLAAVAGALALGLWSTRGGTLTDLLTSRISLGQGVLAGGILAVAHGLFRHQGLYRSYRLGAREALYGRIPRAVALAGLLPAVWGLEWRALATFWLAASVVLVLLRLLLYRGLELLRRRGRNLRYVLVAGAGPRGRRLATALESRLELGYHVVGFLDEGFAGDKLLGGFSDLDKLLGSLPVDEVAVALPLKTYYSEVSHIIAVCEERGVVVRVAADLFPARLARLESEQLEDLSVLTLFTGRGSSWGLLVKRSVDVLVSAAALAALAPLLALLALVVRLDSRGPALYSQIRVGHNGRRFRLWKLRTMVTGAEAQQPELESRNEVQGAAFKIRTDPRITRVGRWLRRTSLDELPQLVNVLRGEMALVGPRPLPLRDVERLRHHWQRRRFSVRPGLTGLWQSSGRHRIGFEDWMRLDLDYIDNWSLLLDLKILLRTLPAVWSGAGAS